jgi:SAM-dependent methyltransferase
MTFVKNIIKPIQNTYKKLSPFGKIVIFLVIFLSVVSFFNYAQSLKKREGFSGNSGNIDTTKFTFYSENDKIYDDFYVNIYDDLVFNNVKTTYEINQIVNDTKPTNNSIILDVGSGTGHHVAELASKNFKVIGIDKSKNMVDKAKELYPKLDFQQGDVLMASMFQKDSFTHILCLYFTIYYLNTNEKAAFFANCMKWLKPGGYLVIHLVDREMFDPILPAANPLLMLSPQRYAKERITQSKITFDDFRYKANFELDPSKNTAKFIENFEDKSSGKVFRKNEHQFYMENVKQILSQAQDVGFIVQGKIDLIKSGYEYNMLYVLVKPE